MGKSNAANWANRWAKGVPDRANDPRRAPEHITDLNEFFGEPKEITKLVIGKPRLANPKPKGDNPRFKCENCGNKGAMDYAGQGRVCKSCASSLGF